MNNDSPTKLTPRQLEVLAGIASGRPRKQVASELRISEQTFTTHCREIYRRLGIHSQTEAVKVAVRMKLVGT